MEITFNGNNKLAEIKRIGEAANQVAAMTAFTDYQDRKSTQTTRRHKADLALFTEYLNSKSIDTGDLYSEPQAWQAVSWGLVKGFVLWMLNKGYAISSTNQRLSTIKVYAKLATQAGSVKPEELAMIRTVAGYRMAEGKNINDKREAAGIDTRIGHKKENWVTMTPEQARRLKKQPDTPQGRRDALLMAILLDHGLRCGEIAGLKVTDIQIESGLLVFYRPKVNKVETHELSREAWAAAKAYYKNDVAAIGLLFRSSNKSGKLTNSGMSEQAITKRVRTLGAAIGLAGLSAHDCRHYGATLLAKKGYSIDRIMGWGGWTSPAMVLRYIEAAKVANSGIDLGND